MLTLSQTSTPSKDMAFQEEDDSQQEVHSTVENDYQEIRQVREAVSEAAASLSAYLSSTTDLSDEDVNADDSSIMSELQRLEGIEDSLRLELEGVSLDENDSSPIIQQKALSELNLDCFKSPSKAVTLDDTYLPSLMLASPSSSTSSDLSRDFSPERCWSLADDSNDSDDTAELDCGGAQDGYLKFQEELDSLIKCLHREEPLTDTTRQHVSKEEINTELRRKCCNASKSSSDQVSIVQTMASVLFGRCEYRVSTRLSPMKGGECLKSYQMTLCIFVAVLHAVTVWFQDSSYLILLRVCLAPCLTWMATHLPLDETVVAFLCWSALLAKVVIGVQDSPDNGGLPAYS